MDCERAQILLSDYIEGGLAGSDFAEVAAHLRECRSCSAGAEGLRETIELLRNLPPVKAPPELSERIREGIVQDRPWIPLWKRLFLPAHVKIPLEAAAAILLFFLVYAAQKEPLPKEVSPQSTTGRGSTLPARDGKENARVPFPAAPTGKDRAVGPPLESPVTAVERSEGQSRKDSTGDIAFPAAGGTARRTPGTPPPSTASPPAKSFLPVVPAHRVSTDDGKIEPPPVPRDETEKSAPAGLFAAPPSRHLRPVPSGREVTIEVSRENRSGLEERIVEAVLGLGGTAIPEPSRQGTAENGALSNFVRVQVPSDSAEDFLAELLKLGTLPAEGMPAWADLPAGPSPGVVAYTVRIRVR